MKKLLALSALVVLGATALPSLADEVWFNKYDRHHAGYWDYPAFRTAEIDYEHHHPDAPHLSPRDLRARFNDLDVNHDGHVTVEEVRDFHHWE